ncbi:MAG: flagellar basal body P-ring formation protein FlgA [FCB group bacterium]|nr:flagellar basal body P-ring formation protein FlgA [FCB group bacterium]
MPESAITLEYRHVPELTIPDQDFRISLETQRPRIQPGYQTVWLSILQNELLIDKVPLVLDVAVRIPVVQSRIRIRRGERISQDDLILSEVTIHDQFDRIFRTPDKLIGKVAKQMIPAGKILFSSMLKEPADADKGAKVNIRLVTGGLTITTQGVLRHEAAVGDEIEVTCLETGKRLAGILTTPENVVVKVR